MKRFKFWFQGVVLLGVVMTSLSVWGHVSCKDMVLKELGGRGFGAQGLFDNFVVESPALWDVVHTLLQIPDGVAVLIVGETGVGKEHVARMVHELSSRRGRPYVVLDSGALPKDLVLSTLFGHVKGSFTGAHRNQTGLLSEANQGTFFLDEVFSLPPEVQHHFLRVLQERVFRPVGSNEELRSDFRLISATNRVPEDMIKRGFREDLYYRLAEFILVVPPLRQRPEDIPALATHFLKQYGSGLVLSELALQRLIEYPWPGNVRQLRQVLIQAVVHAGRRFAKAGDIPGAQTLGEILPEDLQLINRSSEDFEAEIRRLLRSLPTLPALRNMSDLVRFLLLQEAIRRTGTIIGGAAAIKSGHRTAYEVARRVGRPLKPPSEPPKEDASGTL